MLQLPVLNRMFSSRPSLHGSGKYAEEVEKLSETLGMEDHKETMPSSHFSKKEQQAAYWCPAPG